jgi:hypothetical protein
MISFLHKATRIHPGPPSLAEPTASHHTSKKPAGTVTDPAEIRRRIANHTRFKRLVDPWIDLSIEHSRLTMPIAKTEGAQ